MKDIKSFNALLATDYTIILVVLMTIIGEMYSPFKQLLASIFWHHWLAKSIISILFFVVCYEFLSTKKRSKRSLYRQTIRTISIAVASYIIIFGFYTWHYFS